MKKVFLLISGLIIFYFMICLAPARAGEFVAGRVNPGPVYITIWGYGALEVGDLVTVHDQDGVLCGKCVVKEPGIYGQMAVYGDYPRTGEVDEGAEREEELIIKVNEEEVIPLGGRLVWGYNGQIIQVDL